MIAIVRRAGIPAVVAINRFPADSDREIEAVRTAAKAAERPGVEVIEAYERGGKGAENIAEAVAKACDRSRSSGPSTT
jgi:formate--tetrahydrofolate ligase